MDADTNVQIIATLVVASYVVIHLVLWRMQERKR